MVVGKTRLLGHAVSGRVPYPVDHQLKPCAPTPDPEIPGFLCLPDDGGQVGMAGRRGR